MVFICCVCTVQKTCLLSLSGEHRRILEVIVSPPLNLTQVQGIPLYTCDACRGLIDAVMNFKNIALDGASNLLKKLASLQKANNQRLPVEKQPLLPVKQEPNDLLVERSFVEFPIADEKVEPQPTEEAIKTEHPDDNDSCSEPPAPAQQTACQAGYPAVVHTATLNPVAQAPTSRLPTLVLRPLNVAGRAGTDRQTDSPLLAPAEKLATTFPAKALSPLPLASSAVTVKIESDDQQTEALSNQKQPTQARRNVNAKRLRLFPLVPWGCEEDNSEWIAKQKEIKEMLEKKRKERPRPKYPTYYHCFDCNYITRDRAAFLPHRCGKEDIEKSKELKNRKRLKKRPAGAVRSSDWNARLVCDASASKRSRLRPHACPMCPASYKTKAALHLHRRLKHDNEKKYEQNGDVTDELSTALEALQTSMQF